MSDKMVNGRYLPKGIYFERKPAFDWVGEKTNNWHSYLVYRDGQGVFVAVVNSHLSLSIYQNYQKS